MNKNDWQDAGEQFKSLIQDAVESGDFSRLGSTLGDVVNDTVSGLQNALQENLAKQSQDIRNRQGYWGQTRDKYEYTNAEAADRIRKEMEERRSQAKKVVKAPKLLPGERTAGWMKWIGWGAGCIFGLSALMIAGMFAFTGAMPLLLPVGIVSAFAAAGVAAGVKGSGKRAFFKRYRCYKSILGERTFCSIEDLAEAVGKDNSFVAEDLRKMIRERLFKEGYLDSRETVFMTDRSTYQQYLDSQTEYERRRAADEETEAEQNARRAKLTPECREILERGQKYIDYIQKCNQKLEGVEISEKLDRLELVVTRIFLETERNPQVAGELKKMMSYYLPTTQKLLDAYCELDAQPVRGQNIDGTKKEIEDALDTINGAFENLLDSLFQDEAWDISSDVSVLRTMLAQEGLTGSDF